MLIPSEFVILPKTLLKWTTTPHCKSATKFKAKYVKRQKQAENSSTSTTRRTTATETTTISSNIKIATAEEAFNSAQKTCQLNDKSLVTNILLSLSLSCCLLVVNVTRIQSTTYVSALPPLALRVTASVLSLSLSVSLYALVRLLFLLKAQYNQNFLSNAVITKLVVLMNDFRMKTLFKPTTTTITEKTITLIVESSKNVLKVIRTVLVGNKTNKNFNNNCNNKNDNKNTNNNNNNNNNSHHQQQQQPNIQQQILSNFIESFLAFFISPLLPSTINCNNKNNITVAALVTLRLFNNQTFTSNNHRTYNNSSKSNKVFLHYTPRDPRLRIFVNYQQEILFNKHHFASLSELKITEDLCAYGELIGGLSLITTTTTTKNPKTLQQFLSVKYYPYCDFNKINKRTNISQSETVESESVESVANNLIVSDSPKFKLYESQENAASKLEKQQFSFEKFLRNFHFLEPKHFKATITKVGILV